MHWVAVGAHRFKPLKFRKELQVSMEKEQPRTTAATVEGSSAIPLRLPPADVVSEESLLLLQQVFSFLA